MRMYQLQFDPKMHHVHMDGLTRWKKSLFSPLTLRCKLENVLGMAETGLILTPPMSYRFFFFFDGTPSHIWHKLSHSMV